MTGRAATLPRKRLLFSARFFTAGLAKRALTAPSVKRNGKKRKSIQ